LHFLFSDARLDDLVADNNDKFDITESETLLIGRDFGITTDIETGPNGDLFVVSLGNGAVYEISGKQATLFVANLNGSQETPPTNSNATGTATLLLSPDETSAALSLNFSGLSSAETGAHIHALAAWRDRADPFPLANGSLSDVSISLTTTDVASEEWPAVHQCAQQQLSERRDRGQFQGGTSAKQLSIQRGDFIRAGECGSALITVTRLGALRLGNGGLCDQ